MTDEIPQRALRNDVSAILARVAAGEHLRVTVRGKPVADLTPVSDESRFVERSALEAILDRHPLDPGFAGDVDEVLGETVEDV